MYSYNSIRGKTLAAHSLTTTHKHAQAHTHTPDVDGGIHDSGGVFGYLQGFCPSPSTVRVRVYMDVRASYT